MPRLLMPTLFLTLAACSHVDPAERAESYRSAEVAAFQGADKTHGYRNARVTYDARRCARYEGTAEDGQTRQIPLKDWEGRPLCQP